MSSAPSLLVPMKMSALMINTQVLAKPFRRWRTNYTILDKFLSPLPGAFAGEMETGFNQNSDNKGVYLKWELPKALRHGPADRKTGSPDFPLLPNRWLVVRFYGPASKRLAKAWIIESDCPNEDEAHRSDDSTIYLIDPDIVDKWYNSSSPTRQAGAEELLGGNTTADPNGLYTSFLGKPFDLAGWEEQGIDELFLKAVAPGNTEFISYQPNVGNVFSFHDRLQDDSGVSENDAISYMVTGWYSNGADDPVCNWQTADGSDPYAEMLSNFQWEVATNPTEKATSSLYHALVYDLVWQNTALPTEQIQEVSDLHVSIGNNTVDAFQNMIDQQLTDSAKTNPDLAALLGSTANVSKYLEAFQYDMVYKLDEVNGPAMLENRIRQEWFQPKQGGYRWAVSDEMDMDLTSQQEADREAEIAKELPWLNQLNTDQQDLDQLEKNLKAAQSRLYGLWWLWQRWQTYPPFAKPSQTITDQQFEDILDPQTSGSQSELVMNYLGEISGASAKVPHPIYVQGDNDDPQQALQNGIDAFVKTKADAGLLASNRMLKAKAEPDFWHPNDPVLLITGAKNTQVVLDESLLQVRLDSQCITTFTDSGHGNPVDQSALGNLLPTLGFSGLSLANVIEKLYLEAFLLDSVNANSMVTLLTDLSVSELEALMVSPASANYNNVIPALPYGNWVQPWNPLYFEWKVEFYPIGELDSNQTPNWEFNGTDYNYVGSVPSQAGSFEVSGRSILTSQVTAIFEKRLKDYIDQHPDEQIWKDIEAQLETDHWDFLAQSFTNFNHTLSLQNQGSNRLPTTIIVNGNTADITSMVDGQTEILPSPPDNPEAQKFQGLRRGQFFVKEVIIYDEFGQVLDVVESANTGLKSYENFHPILGPELIPDQFIVDQNTFRFIQLPPRVLQHSRLNFRLVDANQPARYVDTDGSANPVAGWLLPNHVDAGISLYDPNGQSLGEVRLLVGDTGNKSVGWSEPPHSSITSIDDVRAAAPLVGEWYDALVAKGPDAMAAFLQVIDETLWTVDPLGGRTDQNLSVLIGRPLALCRAELQFELDGPPVGDQSWDAIFDTDPPAFTQENFQVRLGEQELREDGLIGYYLNQSYDAFHNVHQPQGVTNTYLDPIEKEAYISLKFDGVSKADVMLLVDPRAAVHALTGMHPVYSLTLPEEFVGPALSNMEVSFRIGSLLTQLVSNPDKEVVATVPNAVLMPLPSEQNGTWSWWEMKFSGSSESWTEMGLKNESAKADITAIPKSLRDGFLQLNIDLE